MSRHDVAPAGDEPELEVEAPERAAAGVPGVAYAAKLALQQMGAAAHRADAARGQPGPRLRLPGLRLARAGAARTIAEFCENGAKAVAEEATTARASTRRSSPSTRVAELADAVGLLARPAGPADRADGTLAPGATHYAADRAGTTRSRSIADELRALDSPDEAVFYTSGRTSNEAAFLYQLFVRAFGTNNLPDCSNMCHESSRRRR